MEPVVKLYDKWCAACGAALGRVRKLKRFCESCRQARRWNHAGRLSPVAAWNPEQMRVRPPEGIRGPARCLWQIYEPWDELVRTGTFAGAQGRLCVFRDLVLIGQIASWEVVGLVPLALLDGAVGRERSVKAAAQAEVEAAAQAEVEAEKQSTQPVKAALRVARSRGPMEARACEACGADLGLVLRHNGRRFCSPCVGEMRRAQLALRRAGAVVEIAKAAGDA